jgi:hypothetical protein
MRMDTTADTIRDQRGNPSTLELPMLFSAAGMQPGDTAVTYCHIGQYSQAMSTNSIWQRQTANSSF